MRAKHTCAIGVIPMKRQKRVMVHGDIFCNFLQIVVNPGVKCKRSDRFRSLQSCLSIPLCTDFPIRLAAFQLCSDCNKPRQEQG